MGKIKEVIANLAEKVAAYIDKGINDPDRIDDLMLISAKSYEEEMYNEFRDEIWKMAQEFANESSKKDYNKFVDPYAYLRDEYEERDRVSRFKRRGNKELDWDEMEEPYIDESTKNTIPIKARKVNETLNEHYDDDYDWEDQDSGHTVNGERKTNGEMLDYFREHGEPGDIPPEFEERLGIRRRRW